MALRYEERKVACLEQNPELLEARRLSQSTFDPIELGKLSLRPTGLARETALKLQNLRHGAFIRAFARRI